MASHPAVAGMSTLTPAQDQQLNLQAAHLFERLMLVDCRPQIVAALKNEGQTAMETGFRVLGEVAARGLFSDPAINAQTQAMGKMVDPTKMAELGKEAGLPSPAAAAATPAAKK